MNTVTNEGTTVNTAGSGLINIEGGEIFINGVTGIAVNGNVLTAHDLQARLQSNTFRATNGYGCSFTNSSLQMFETNIGVTGDSCLIMQTDNFRIDGFTGFTDTNSVIRIQQNSKGYLANAHGNISSAFGVDLLSASSFSNGGGNDVSGAGGPGTNDVNTGSAGSSSWGALITNDFPPVLNPQYVTISPP